MQAARVALLWGLGLLAEAAIFVWMSHVVSPKRPCSLSQMGVKLVIDSGLLRLKSGKYLKIYPGLQPPKCNRRFNFPQAISTSQCSTD